ncbi:MAG TPA: hypothetical protein VFZ73_00055, partial [Gemmatimonadaceae bacterium]
QNQFECIPGKLFEYVQMSSWVLALTDAGTAVDLVLEDSSADVVRPDDTDRIAHVIAQRYTEFRRGARPSPVNADGRFDREREAERLFNALDGIAATASR